MFALEKEILRSKIGLRYPRALGGYPIDVILDCFDLRVRFCEVHDLRTCSEIFCSAGVRGQIAVSLDVASLVSSDPILKGKVGCQAA